MKKYVRIAIIPLALTMILLLLADAGILCPLYKSTTYYDRVQATFVEKISVCGMTIKTKADETIISKSIPAPPAGSVLVKVASNGPFCTSSDTTAFGSVCFDALSVLSLIENDSLRNELCHRFYKTLTSEDINETYKILIQLGFE